jgi:hypothetical protein
MSRERVEQAARIAQSGRQRAASSSAAPRYTRERLRGENAAASPKTPTASSALCNTSRASSSASNTSLGMGPPLSAAISSSTKPSLCR